MAVLALGFAIASGIALGQLLDDTYAITSQLESRPAKDKAAASQTRVLADSDFIRNIQSGAFFREQRSRRRQFKIINNDSKSRLGALDPELAPFMRSLGLGGRGTYRTVCVRLCDGFYFPISASTTRDRFGVDDRACRSKCGSDSRLFVYNTAGGSPDTMVDVRGRAYANLETAFRYRTAYDAACKCRAHPWEPDSIKAHKAYASKEWKRKAQRLAKAEAWRARKARRVAQRRAKQLAVLQRELLDADDDDDKREVIERWRSRLPKTFVVRGVSRQRVAEQTPARTANVERPARIMRLGVRERRKSRSRPRVRKQRNSNWKRRIFQSSN